MNYKIAPANLQSMICRGVFTPGKITFLIDGPHGSSGKAKLESFVVKNANLTGKPKCNFLVSTNSPNASHTVIDGGKTYVFKILPSSSLYHEHLEAIYICSGASFEVATLFKEMEMINIPRSKVKIHPRAGIISQIDKDLEKGLCDIDGDYYDTKNRKAGTIKTGTTCSGAGSNLMKKVIRSKTLVTASDIPELKEMMCICEEEILERLDNNQAGMFALCQGFGLSNNYWRFAPYTTSRNVTIGHALSDSFLPPSVVGNVLINFRCHPIRIHSKKYESKDKPGEYLTWDDVKAGVPHNVIESPSGDFYPDSVEIEWDDVMDQCGLNIPTSISNTTLTKLPRRIATHSKINLDEAIKYNQTTSNVYIAYNFCQWVDGDMENAVAKITPKMRTWLAENVEEIIGKYRNVKLFGLGTSQETDHYTIFE